MNEDYVLINVKNVMLDNGDDGWIHVMMVITSG